MDLQKIVKKQYVLYPILNGYVVNKDSKFKHIPLGLVSYLNTYT